MAQENFIVTGMTCSACSAHVEKAVRKLPGVSAANVNLMTGGMSVTFENLDRQDIIDAVIAAGYGCENAGESAREKRSERQQQELKRKRNSLLLSILFLIPLFYLAMGHMMGAPIPGALHRNQFLYALVQLILLLPILWWNRSYFIVGFSRLFRLAPNMDSLVALGAAAGLIYSLIEMASLPHGMGETMPELYFESAGMILALVSVGKYMEKRSNLKTTEAVSSLLALAPQSAVVKREGQEYTVPVSEVAAGDLVILRQGGKVPVDGTLVTGQAAVDESALTGESLPVEKNPGDTLTAGTVLRWGYAEMEAKRVGADTTLAQIVRLMEEAASSKAPISKLADRVSGVFVPVVMSIALVAALLWGTVGGMGVSFALSIGIAVLVISCPCALGLATPVAIMIGTGAAAKQGILIKSAESLELLGKVDAVVLDKTGTVTEGRPQVTDVLTADGVTEERLLVAAASVEQLSEHPLAQAILREAERRGLRLQEAEDFQASAGGGVSARLGEKTVLGGNRRLMEASGVDISAFDAAAEGFASKGKTPLYFAEGQTLLGIIGVADVVRASSRNALEDFRRLGTEVVLLTGDNRRTADAIAKDLGIETVYAEVLPADKQRCITDLQAKGRTVAMIGDGINDAPALAAADVGVAIGAGTDIALESADVVLMKSDLSDAAAAMQLSRAVLKNIRQNLFWAFFYNTVGIPIAAGALYPLLQLRLNPMLAAAAMSLSSLCVVGNALRLRRWKPSLTHTYREEVPEENTTSHKEETKDMSNVQTVKIEGMMCSHCSGRVEKALNAIEGVQATVDLAAGTATVRGEASAEALRKAVEDAGYTVLSVE
ncbi:MAG: heavy metal translocating P-type ATPase [Oscillospiraceae bacterium]